MASQSSSAKSCWSAFGCAQTGAAPQFCLETAEREGGSGPPEITKNRGGGEARAPRMALPAARYAFASASASASSALPAILSTSPLIHTSESCSCNASISVTPCPDPSSAVCCCRRREMVESSSATVVRPVGSEDGRLLPASGEAATRCVIRERL